MRKIMIAITRVPGQLRLTIRKLLSGSVRATPRVRGGQVLLALFALAAPLTAQANGSDVLKKMHDAYAGKWYSTLTFRQKTTMAGGAGAAPTEQTRYEALQYT